MMKKGFTFIELLVVIAIMVILTAISLFALQGARESARDTRRKSDLEVIRSGLELYRADCNSYPASISFGGSLTGNPPPASCSNSNIYISKVPSDPSSGRNYSYVSVPPYTTYNLCASLEQGGGSVTGCGSCGQACNYKVSGP
jgi:general secretion pathway protein G